MRLDERGTQFVIPFLLFVAFFIAGITAFYGMYQTTVEETENMMMEREMETRYGDPYAHLVRSSVTVPINYAEAYENVYGDSPEPYHKVVGFIWDKYEIYIMVEVMHSDNYHDSNSFGLTMYVIGRDNKTYSIAWVNINTGDSPLVVGDDYWSEAGIVSGTIVMPSLVATAGPAGIPAMIIYAWLTSPPHVEYTEAAKQNMPVWNVKIEMENLRKTVGAGDNLTWGYVDLTYSTYASGILGGAGRAISGVATAVKDAFAGLFGAIFGDAGRQFVNMVGSALTLDLPGIPLIIRGIFAIPIALVTAYIIAIFIRGFIPFLGGGG